MKVLLINPPFNRLKKLYMPYVPLGLQYLSAVLNANGFKAVIYNADGPDPYIKRSIPLLSDKFDGHDDYIKALQNEDHPIWEEIRNVVKREKPDVLGLTATSPAFPAAKKIAHLARYLLPECCIVMGGMHATVQPQETLKNEVFDFVVCGEGEETLLALVRGLSRGGQKKDPRFFDSISGLFYRDKHCIVSTGERTMFEQLDPLPYPARHTVLNPFPHGEDKKALLATRGCLYACKYCNSQQLWKQTFRMRSVSNVVAEMDYLAREYNTKLFEFKDETFTISREWVVSLCRSLGTADRLWEWSCATRVDLIDEKLIRLMARAGCIHITFGIESGSPDTLTKINKRIDLDYAVQMCRVVKKEGMILNINMIMGMPCESENAFDESKKIMRQIRPHRICIGSFIPLPKSRLQVEYGLPDIPDDQWSHYSFHSWHNRSSNPQITSQQFQSLLKDLINYADRYNRAFVREGVQSIRRRIRKSLKKKTDWI
jgi:anaerobic magnesium-protoporphyrin IX monomethyl ester cyclase